MSTSNTHQQSLVDAGSETRPPMLERAPRTQKEEDLRGDDLKHYEAEIEAMNLILISIPNDIYNSVDARTIAKAMWQRVEQALASVYNRFAQLMNDLERNGIIFPKFTINTKFLNCLQPKWLKYVTQSKKVGKSHDPLALVAHTSSSSRTTTPYYVTHPSSVVDYDDDYQGDVVQNNYEDPLTSATILLAYAITQCFSNPTSNRLRTSSNARNQAIVQGERVKIQSKNSGNDGKNIRRSYVQEEIIEGTSYDYAFLSEVQTPSTSYVNPLFAKDTQEQKYPKQPKIINNTIGDDQIDNNIIFDEPNGDVNSGSVEYDNNVQESYALEQ
nr:hypothetical protein [Tanacetum cinerariifolium]